MMFTAPAHAGVGYPRGAMYSSTESVIVGSFAQALGAIILALLLWSFHGHYRRGYQLNWGLSWLAYALQMTSAALAIGLLADQPPGAGLRLGMAILGSTAAYMNAAWLVAGSWEMARQRIMPPRRVLLVLPLAVALALLTSVLFSSDAGGGGSRYLLRVGVRSLITGVAFMVAAIAAWPAAGDPARGGRRVLSLGFLLFGLERFHYVLLGFLATGGSAGFGYTRYLSTADFLLQWVIGLGMVMSLLEEERATAERHARQAEHQALHDALTGLPNRRLLLDRLGLALVHARRTSTHVGVVFVDLDRFKVINDSLGHSAGDQLLQEAGERLRRAVRADDTVARIGGDEFVILLPDLPGPRSAHSVVRKVTDALRPPFRIEGHDLFVTPSAGVSVAPDDGGDEETLLKHADVAMYRAKDAGGDAVVFFAPAMNVRAHEILETESALRRALGAGELRLHYQPVWDMTTGRVAALEALIRWEHPQRGLVGPGQFMEVAESSGLVVPMGSWVLQEACGQLGEWHRAGRTDLSMFVNISARQLVRAELIAEVRGALSAAGLLAPCLELEITEGVAMQDAYATESTLAGLKALGVRISIDDFGTGYSSFSYLRRFRIDALKIDRSFVCDVDQDEGHAAIVSAMIAMAHRLGLRVVGEGVERSGQLEFLCTQRCDLVQGFLLARPLPPDEVTALLHAEDRSYDRSDAAAGAFHR
jgi:diguanylate cyclase (GGDEF)-like protein